LTLEIDGHAVGSATYEGTDNDPDMVIG